MPKGADTLKFMADQGATPDQLNAYRAAKSEKLMQLGLDESQVKEYFGIPEPDMKPLEQVYERNTEAVRQRNSQQGTAGGGQEGATAEPLPAPQRPQIPENESTQFLPGEVPQPIKPQEKKVEVADSIIEAIEAGWDMSVAGLIQQGGKPDVVLPENAPMYHRIASQLTTLVGDLPAMVAGGVSGAVAGGAAGTAVLPGPGTVGGTAIGTFTGGFAAPAGMREALMQYYDEGSIETFSDFWERASAVMIATGKGALTGAATGVASLAAGGAAAALGARAAVKTGSQIVAEIATMTTVGAALEGEMPKANDFLDAAIIIGGLRTTVPLARNTAKKLRDIYKETGIKPEQVAEQVKSDPVLRQEILAETKEIPKSYEPFKEPGVKVGGELSIRAASEKVPTEAKPPLLQAEKPAPRPAEVAEASAKVSESLGLKKQDAKTPAAERIKQTQKEMYADFVDKLDPLADIAKVAESQRGAKLETLQNPYEIARLNAGNIAKVRHFYEFGITDFNTGKVVSKSFQEIVKPFEKNMDGFAQYLIARRALELNKREIKSGVDIAAAETLVKGNKAKFEKAASELTEFQNKMTEYLADAGIISKDALANIKELNQMYVPFRRIQVDGKAKGVSSSQPIKKIKGSELAIQNPFVSILDNMDLYTRIAEKNRAKQALIKLEPEVLAEFGIQRVKTDFQPVKISSKEITKALREQGLELDADGFTVFRPKQRGLAPGEFDVYVDGKRQIYKVDNPKVAQALNELGQFNSVNNVFLRMMGAITSFKKLGISLAPEFALKNVFRDQISAGVFSKSKTLPFLDMPSAFMDVIGKREAYQSWLKSGGGSGTFLDFNRTYLDQQVFKLNNQTGFMDATFNVVKKPVQFLEIAGSIFEQTTRVAEFKKVAGGARDMNTLAKAGLASREISLDFSRKGAKLQALNAITAYQNVAIQGLDKIVRAFKEDPKGMAVRGVGYITVPSVLLWYANHEDPRYQEIPRWQKDLFWIVPTDDWQKAQPGEANGLPDHLVRQTADGFEINKGTIYRIPKPQELGILFGSSVERTLDAFFTDNPGAFKDFQETMFEMATPALIPDAVAPGVEMFFNKNLFTGRDIIPQHLEGVAGPYQYTHFTSETAKLLGKMIGQIPVVNNLGIRDAKISSPLVIDHILSSWTGTIGRYAIDATDEALIASGAVKDPVRPADTVADIPFVRAFTVRYPSSGAESIKDFYETANKFEGFQKTLKNLQNMQDFESLEKLAFAKENQIKFVKLDQAKKALSTMSQTIRNVNATKDMNRDEKRQIIDRIYYQMIELARAQNEQLNQLSKDMGGL
jgi:hypothetical protein